MSLPAESHALQSCHVPLSHMLFTHVTFRHLAAVHSSSYHWDRALSLLSHFSHIVEGRRLLSQSYAVASRPLPPTPLPCAHLPASRLPFTSLVPRQTAPFPPLPSLPQEGKLRRLPVLSVICRSLTSLAVHLFAVHSLAGRSLKVHNWQTALYCPKSGGRAPL
jgi:hypothetical protein